MFDGSGSATLLAAGVVGRALLALVSPGAVRFFRVNADGTVDFRSASDYRTDLGLGTIATQDANAVAITGGTINGTSVGAGTASTGRFTNLEATGTLGVAGNAQVGAELRLDNTSASGTGQRNAVRFFSRDSAATLDQMALVDVNVTNATSGAEASTLRFWNVRAGALAANLQLGANGITVTGGVDSTAKGTISGGHVTYSATGFNDGCLVLSSGNASGSARGIRFRNTGGGGEAFFGTVQTASGREQFVAQGYNGSAYQEYVRITESGNVGIGTSSPGERLVVAGNIDVAGFVMISDSGISARYSVGGYYSTATSTSRRASFEAQTTVSSITYSAFMDMQVHASTVSSNYIGLCFDGEAVAHGLYVRKASAETANACLFTDTTDFQGGQQILFVANRESAPTGNPSGGGFLYAESGALKWRGSGGTITTIAAA